MKMKKTDYIRILSLLLAASVLMGGCSSRSAQQSEQTSQPVQQETQVEEEPSETSEQDQQQEREQEPQETSEEDQQQNDSAQEEAPPQDEAQSGEEADNPSEQAPEIQRKQKKTQSKRKMLHPTGRPIRRSSTCSTTNLLSRCVHPRSCSRIFARTAAGFWQSCLVRPDGVWL